MTAGLELSPGTLIDGRYHIQRVLGRGGFGRTYLAADARRFGELCVLKEFAPSNQSDPVVAQKLRELFHREATTLHKLNHPQIPQFIAVFETGGRLFIAQEYIDGKTYWRVLQERQQQNKTFTEAEVLQWLKDLLRVLDYVHAQHIVHRDIAPDNIMLPRGGKFPVLIDFGVVKQVATHFYGMSSADSDGLIQASVSVGKFGYAPYEQIRMGQCSPKSDLYALAVTAVVLLTGKPPNLLIDPRSLEWHWQTQIRIHSQLVEVLEKMMAEKPQDRYASAKAVLRDLQFLNNRSGNQKSSAPILSQHPKYGPGIALTPRQLDHTGIKLVSPPHYLLSYAQAPLAAAVATAAPALSDPADTTHAEPLTPIEKLTGLNRQTKAQFHTQISRSGFDAFTTGFTAISGRSTMTPITVSPQTTSRMLLKESQVSPLRLSNVVALGLLTLLPLGGVVVGVQSPYIASVCRALKNCAGDTQSEVRYRRAVEQAVGAKTLSEKARNLSDLQQARDRLVDSLSQLSAFSGGTQVYTKAQQVLLTYRGTLQNLETALEKETRATQLLRRAEAEAQKATEQTKAAQTVQAYEAAHLQWQRSVNTLKAIQPGTFVASPVASRLQEYTARLQTVSLRIPPSRRQSLPELLQPTIVQLAGTQRRENRQSRVSTSDPEDLQASRSGQAQQASAAPQQVNLPAVQPQTMPKTSSQPPRRIPAYTNYAAANYIARALPSRIPPSVPRSPLRPNVLSSPTRLATSVPNPGRALSTGSVPLSALQTLNNVSLELDGAWLNPGGTYVANLVFENSSDRAFGFVPLFAEVRDGSGQPIQSRILLRGSEDGVIEPGKTLRGQLFLLDRRWSTAGAQNLTLVIREGTSGNRSFNLPF